MERDLKRIFADNLKRYMERDDKTQTEIAKLTGVSQSTASDWINGRKYPRMDKVEVLASYFNIRKSDLVEDCGELAGLSLDEIKLLDAYRKLDPAIKEYILLGAINATKVK
jgi:transcriptional regulator with XRE-family HTH domain